MVAKSKQNTTAKNKAEVTERKEHIQRFMDFINGAVAHDAKADSLVAQATFELKWLMGELHVQPMNVDGDLETKEVVEWCKNKLCPVLGVVWTLNKKSAKTGKSVLTDAQRKRIVQAAYVAHYDLRDSVLTTAEVKIYETDKDGKVKRDNKGVAIQAKDKDGNPMTERKAISDKGLFYCHGHHLPENKREQKDVASYLQAMSFSDLFKIARNEFKPAEEPGKDHLRIDAERFLAKLNDEYTGEHVTDINAPILSNIAARISDILGQYERIKAAGGTDGKTKQEIAALLMGNQATDDGLTDEDYTAGKAVRGTTQKLAKKKAA